MTTQESDRRGQVGQQGTTVQRTGGPVTFDEAVTALRRGEIVAAATETLIGLLGDARRPEVVARVAELKGRSEHQPIALLLPDSASLEAISASVSPAARRLAAAHWPGPLTLLVTARPGLSPLLVRDGRVGARVPGASPALDLVRAFGGPLTATSANPTGQPAAVDTEALAASLREHVWVLPGRAPGGQASTLVDACVDPPRVLRPGPIALT